jgi:spore germination protein
VDLDSSNNNTTWQPCFWEIICFIGGISLNKRNSWIVALLIIGGIIISLWVMSSRAYSAQNALEAAHQRCFYNLIDRVNNINILISKCMVTSSNQQRIMTLTTIWHQAEAARENLSSLPLGQQDMTNCQKFFAQLGDFSYTLAQKAVKNNEITANEWKKMEVFKDNSATLNKQLRKIQEKVASGRIKWENQTFLKGKTQDLQSGIAEDFANIDQKLKKEAPTITYDGPFSDHTEEIRPKGLKNKIITETEAQDIAKKFIIGRNNNKYDIKVTGKVKGVIPAYSIEFKRGKSNSPNIVADVSKQGGHVLWFLNTRKIEEQKISVDEAKDKANTFLNSRGFDNMKATGYLKEDNTVTFTFVPTSEEILLYPDFIKVEIALDNGQVVGADTVAYYTFHTERKFDKVKFSKQDIMKILSKNLRVNKVRLALIPDPSLKERLCYEVDAKLGEERFYIYINAQNGEEEQILKVVETQKGIMTM